MQAAPALTDQQRCSTLGARPPLPRGVAFNLPPALNPSLAGTTLHHAYVVFDLTSSPGNAFVSFVSNPAPVSFLP